MFDAVRKLRRRRGSVELELDREVAIVECDAVAARVERDGGVEDLELAAGELGLVKKQHRVLRFHAELVDEVDVGLLHDRESDLDVLATDVLEDGLRWCCGTE